MSKRLTSEGLVEGRLAITLYYDEQLQCEVPPKSKYSSRFLV